MRCRCVIVPSLPCLLQQQSVCMYFVLRPPLRLHPLPFPALPCPALLFITCHPCPSWTSPCPALPCPALHSSAVRWKKPSISTDVHHTITFTHLQHRTLTLLYLCFLGGVSLAADIVVASSTRSDALSPDAIPDHGLGAICATRLLLQSTTDRRSLDHQQP